MFTATKCSTGLAHQTHCTAFPEATRLLTDHNSILPIQRQRPPTPTPGIHLYDMTAIGNHNEIVDRIIGHVREVSDGHFRTPLKSCALVSKAWLPQSQRYLFHHISLQFGTELKRWCRNITKERAQVLSKYVRWLSYSPPYKTKDANALERFAYFTHLETLCIFKVDFGKFSDDKDEFQSVFGHFGNSPRYLVIDRCLGHFPTIINLFRLLPNLTHLDIFHTTLPYTCLLTDSDMSGDFGKIETLRMTGTERYFINALMPARFTGLKNISYFDKGPESAGDLRVFLNNCKTLETLTVLSSHNLNHPREYSLSAPLCIPRIHWAPTCICFKTTTGADVQKITRSSRVGISAKSHSTTYTPTNPIPKSSQSYLQSILRISQLLLSLRKMQMLISTLPQVSIGRGLTKYWRFSGKT